MIRFIVGTTLTLALLLGTLLLEGGNAWSLLGLSAFLMVWFVPFFASAAVWGYRAWGQAWGAAFHPVEATVARRSVSLWKFNEFAFYLAGFLAFCMGMILILGSLGQPAAFTRGWQYSVAAALVAPFYGFFFGYMARILRARVATINP